METVGIGFYFEDLPIGRQFQTVGRTVTETDIVGFINAIGMTEVLFTNIEFLKHESDIKGPVFAGDTIHVECEVIESRRSRSRPNRGLVRTRNRIVKQDGTLVQEYTPLRMVKARETAK